jgi:hypothetical protein
MQRLDRLPQTLPPSSEASERTEWLEALECALQTSSQRLSRGRKFSAWLRNLPVCRLAFKLFGGKTKTKRQAHFLETPGKTVERTTQLPRGVVFSHTASTVGMQLGGMQLGDTPLGGYAGKRRPDYFKTRAEQEFLAMSSQTQNRTLN